MKCYSCPKSLIIPWIIGPTLVFGFSLILLAISLSAIIFLGIVGALSLHAKDIPVADALGALASGVLVNLVSGIMVNIPADVCIDTQGFYVRVFIAKRIFVPWENLLDIKIPFRFDRNQEIIWVVQVKRLTLWHRFIGLTYGAGWTPSFIITSDMDGCKELRRILTTHLEQH